jgi:hypothetical protein
MVNRELNAGTDSYLLYGAESTYGTAATVDKIFGLVKSFTPTLNNTLIKSRGFAGSTSGGRDVVKVTGGKFEGSFSVELEPLNFDWLQYVLGSRTGSGTIASPYAYAGSNTLSSLTVSNCLNNVTTDREMAYLGCVFNSVTIKAAVGEPMTATMEFLAADVDKDSTIPSNVAITDVLPYTFAGGSIEIPNDAAIPNIIDSVEFSITNNTKLIHGLGSRVGRRKSEGERDYQIKVTVKYVDETLINLFLGNASGPTNPTESATVAVRFDNADAVRYVDFIFTGATIDTYSETNNLNEMIVEEHTFIARTLAVNEVQTAA